MREFAEAFLLVFAQLGVGGLLSLSVPPFHQLERGFYKSTAAVYLAAAVIPVAGWSWLLLTREIDSGVLPWRWLEVGTWTAFCALFGLYLYSLWGEPYRLRARSYLAALAVGFAAVTLTALRYAPGGVSAFVYPLAFLASAVLLGAVATGMLLGHWYLIDTGLTLTPFLRIHRFFVGAIHAEVVVLILSTGFLASAAMPGVEGAVSRLWSDHAWLLALRIVLGPLAAYTLSWMIGRTLAVPQTMAATGLFYIALLAVVVGEILGRTLLFRTALPL